jgi:nanoRNase/pAp phosphatase (c-di-AMP/oligoRNAs hydrolase)
MLHNDPDPDAMASGLALRNVLRRTDDRDHRRDSGRRGRRTCG